MAQTGNISTLTIELEGTRHRNAIFQQIRAVFRRRRLRRQSAEECVPIVRLEPDADATPSWVDKLTRLCKGKVSFKFDTLENLEESCRDVEHPDRVGKFSLTYTTLMSIPLSIARFSNLTVLLLPHNAISELPWSLVCLRKLRVLDLSHNRLTAVPSLMGYVPSLQRLLLSHNNITVLPTSLINLVHLTELALAGNEMVSPPKQICDDGLEAIFAALRSRLSRSNLWARTYQGSGDPCGVKTLLEVCVQCILDCQMDILNAPVPPMLKNYLIEEKTVLESKLLLAKCDQCRGYFSSMERFNNHHCRMQPPPQRRAVEFVCV